MKSAYFLHREEYGGRMKDGEKYEKLRLGSITQVINTHTLYPGLTTSHKETVRVILFKIKMVSDVN